jgi:hypothetical protein
MADLAAYDTLIGVALGAGLTYGFGALNRRHQEEREDKTRWYQARLDAYADFYQAMSDWWLLAAREDFTAAERAKLIGRLSNALGFIHLVGSPEIVITANVLFKETTQESKDKAQSKFAVFVFAARKDLGYPVVPSVQREIDRALPPLDEDG